MQLDCLYRQYTYHRMRIPARYLWEPVFQGAAWGLELASKGCWLPLPLAEHVSQWLSEAALMFAVSVLLWAEARLPLAAQELA